MTEKRKIKVGIVGAGGVTKDLHLPVLVNMPEINIEWICDINKAIAKRLANLFKIKKVYQNIEQCDEIDIVLIAIPVGYRKDVMKKVIKRGWNIFCEKPFAITLEEHKQYLEMAEQQKIQSCIGFVRRYCGATSKARELIRHKRFGPIKKIWASEGFRTKRTGRDGGWYIADPNAVGGGMLMETGTHLVDQICHIADIKGFKLISCVQQKSNGLDLETKFVGRISNSQQDEIEVVFELSKINDLCNGVFIQFENFILKCGLGFESDLEMCDMNGQPFAKIETDQLTENAAFYWEWKDFLNQCLTKIPSIINADSGVFTTSIIEQCYLNAK